VFELAWQNARRQPGRLAASAGAVASSVMLVLVAGGLYLGLLAAIAGYPRSLPGAVVVTEAGGSATMLHSSSHLAADAVRTVTAVDGVTAVHPLYGRLAWLERSGRQALVYLVGIDRHDDFGLPVHVLAGHARPALAEIVVDHVLAHDLALAVGDTLEIGDARLRVGGIASGGNAVLGSYAFVSRGALELAGVQQPSYLFVETAPGVEPEALVARIGALPGLAAMSRATFMQRNQALARQMVLPLIAIIVAITAVVSGNTVALTLYAATIERREEYGLLKALGVPQRWLYGTAVLQSLIASGVGLAVGLVAGWATAGLIELVQPRFVTVLPLWLSAAIALGAVVVGLVAALRPVRALARIDPALVFRA
jgi:putative ABC transport system permease protein